MHKESVSVVYLCWLPYGIQLFKEFIDSYQSCSSGHSHQLVLLFNGIQREEDTADYHEYVQKTGIIYTPFYYFKGQDLEAYHWIAGRLSTHFILFLNSYSRFLADNWLLKFVHASSDKNVGLVGATGSWQSHYSMVFEIYKWRWAKGNTLQQHIVKYKLMLKALFLWRWYFKPFPNPHVRTNSFFINRALFLTIKYRNPTVKFDAYRIESGRSGITQQILKKGFQALLVDKFGNTFKPEEWDTAKVFWSYQQEHLLISDNQTRMYDEALPEQRASLSYSAWRQGSLPG